MLKLAVVSEDIAYASALAKALAAVCRAGRVLYLSEERAAVTDLSDFIVLSDSREFLSRTTCCSGIYMAEERLSEDHKVPWIGKWQSVKIIGSRIMALHTNKPIVPPFFQNIPFTVFTSGCGGCGTTSSAMVFARLQAEKTKEKIGFLSLDPEFRQAYCGEDEYGVCHLSVLNPNPFVAKDAEGFARGLNAIGTEEGCGQIVMDAPSCLYGIRDILDMAEKRVIVYGWLPHRHYASERLFEMLEAEKTLYTANVPGTYKLLNSFDEFSFSGSEPDIHGQLGGEVLELAGRMEE